MAASRSWKRQGNQGNDFSLRAFWRKPWDWLWPLDLQNCKGITLFYFKPGTLLCVNRKLQQAGCKGFKPHKDLLGQGRAVCKGREIAASGRMDGQGTGGLQRQDLSFICHLSHHTHCHHTEQHVLPQILHAATRSSLCLHHLLRKPFYPSPASPLHPQPPVLAKLHLPSVFPWPSLLPGIKAYWAGSSLSPGTGSIHLYIPSLIQSRSVGSEWSRNEWVNKIVLGKVGRVMAGSVSEKGGQLLPSPLVMVEVVADISESPITSSWTPLILSTTASSPQAQIYFLLRHLCSDQLWESFCPGSSPVPWHLPWSFSRCNPETQESYQPHSARKSRDSFSCPLGEKFWEADLS